MKTVIFWMAYFAVAVGANLLMTVAGVHGWLEWLIYVPCDLVIYSALRWSIEPGWLRRSYKIALVHHPLDFPPWERNRGGFPKSLAGCARQI